LCGGGGGIGASREGLDGGGGAVPGRCGGDTLTGFASGGGGGRLIAAPGCDGGIFGAGSDTGPLAAGREEGGERGSDGVGRGT
jgi:hypothetical protein